jgi:hypothetical protein
METYGEMDAKVHADRERASGKHRIWVWVGPRSAKAGLDSELNLLPPPPGDPILTAPPHLVQPVA